MEQHSAYIELLEKYASVTQIILIAYKLVGKSIVPERNATACYDYLTACHREMTGMQYMPDKVQLGVLNEMYKEIRSMVAFLYTQAPTLKIPIRKTTLHLVSEKQHNEDTTEKVEILIGRNTHGNH